jgi:exodeoxyribonuclease V alpha subunit
MALSTRQLSSEKLIGFIERITFHSEKTGFCVLKVKARGRRDIVTVIAQAARILAGESIEAVGGWTHHKNHGLQFNAAQLRIIPPNGLDGIEKYLGSGLVKGIGPYFAKQLVKVLGASVFDVIKHTPERLNEVPGIGKKRQKKILVFWAEQKAIRDIMVFLQGHGLGTSRAFRIYKTYGEQAIEKVKENPYRLASDIRGIGFKTADQLAKSLGLPEDSPLRARAGLQHSLLLAGQEGHCALLQTDLIQATHKLLNVSESIIATAIGAEVAAKELIQNFSNDNITLALKSFYQAEVSVAKRLKYLLCGGSFPWGKIDPDKAIPWVEKQTVLQLASSQKAAITQALQSKVMIISGGPGVGKTTVVNSLIKIFQTRQLTIELCAPTGRAAKRLSEVTGLVAKTIHRCLGFDPHIFGFKHHADFPLPADIIVVDEVSMLDITLMNQLLKAIPEKAALFLIGDIDQLPSVGPGSVLADLMTSKQIPTVFLTEIFRQAATSQIIVNAHRVNQGKMPVKNSSSSSDFYFIPANTPEEIQTKLIHCVTHRIPQRFKFHPLRDIQVLTPMNRGVVGAYQLNHALQQALNASSEPKIQRFGWTFSKGDKVIQTINNYDKEVFNGDIGFIAKIDLEETTIQINFEERLVDYDFNEMDEIALAYATSIHKSQGSEYKAVVIPIAMQHYRLLARNLLYTGITRGKKLVILIGQYKALAIAVHQQPSQQRLTQLIQRMTEIF